MEVQSYSSLDNRDRFETVIQTTIPSDMWSSPMVPPPRLPPQPHVFTVEGHESQQNSSPSNRKTNCCFSKQCCVIFRLIISCMFLTIVTLCLLGYSTWTAWEIYNWTIESNADGPSDLWKYTDETTICVTLSGKDLEHSGCAKYLFHDILDTANYTCCVRDSRQFSFLYQLVHIERKRLDTTVRNNVCTHANAVEDKSSVRSDVLLWTPFLHCELTGGKEQDTKFRKIGISSSNMYAVYLAVPVRYQKTYKILRYHKIRVKLFRQHGNQTFAHEELMHKMVEVRKEHYNFDNIFMHGTFYLRKGDKLYVQVQNGQFLYPYEEYTSIDLFKIMR